MKDQIKDWNLEPAQAAEWEKAANEWRLPYWDWAGEQATRKNKLPIIFETEEITVYPPNTPRGETKVENPFWDFKNPMKDDNGNPRAFGDMPPGKTQWKIPDHVIKGKNGKPDTVLPVS